MRGDVLKADEVGGRIADDPDTPVAGGKDRGGNFVVKIGE